ncbi:MAG: hypothetical protein H0W50_10205 [Parachlamydiaceae bacterium]|nr:hypothetical protein [Parachlamydiaceae bacterium]
MDADSGKPFKRVDFLEAVHHYIKRSPGRTVSLRSLSEKFFGDPAHLINYVEENEIILNGEFKAHLASLRSFVQIEAKADDIELSFPKSLYRSVVRIDNKDKNQIIIKSEKLAAQLRDLVRN